MDYSEIIKQVRKIEIVTKGLSNHLFAGEYHSAFKGKGMSFSEVREYQYGDDIRTIDWNVSSRFSSPYVKVFEEERELTLMLLIDLSSSMFFGTKKKLKSTLLAEISALLAFSAQTNNDKIGVIFFTDRIEKFIPPKKGRTHILRIIKEILDFKAEGTKTDIKNAIDFLNKTVKKKSVCFLISDFNNTDFFNPLKIAAKKHDLIAIQILDPAEEILNNDELVFVKDPESGLFGWIDAGFPAFKQSLKNEFLQNKLILQRNFKEIGVDLITLYTHKTFQTELLKFFRGRRHKK